SPSHWRYVRSRPSTICEQLLEWLQRLRWLRFHQVARRQRRHEIRFHYRATADVTDGAVEAGFLAVRRANALSRPRQIGRASCRERGEISVVAVSLKRKRCEVYKEG